MSFNLFNLNLEEQIIQNQIYNKSGVICLMKKNKAEQEGRTWGYKEALYIWKLLQALW